jgi:hypothetical protein
MRRLFGRLLSVFLPGTGLRCMSLTVVEESYSFSRLQENISERDPMNHMGMTLVFQDGHGLMVRTRGSNPLRWR